MKRVFLLCVVVVLASCGAPVATDSQDSSVAGLGTVDGYSATSEIAVTIEDGLNASEREALTSRSMARIEIIRGLEFQRPVDVEVISRQEYRENQVSLANDQQASEWNNRVWKGLFLVGDDREVSDVFNETFGGSVQGYYLIGQDSIVIVSDGDNPTIQPGTLVHELVHALQDQHFGIGGRPATQDGQLAHQGVVEGEANLVPDRYRERCGEEWSCLESPAINSNSNTTDQGVFHVILQPYVQGSNFVEYIQERSGWPAVDDLHDSYPASTEQTIHPDSYPAETPVSVTVADRSDDGWSRFDHNPVGETLGEAAIHTMFRENDIIDARQYSYRHPVSEGWGGDTLVPYRHGETSGYVWETRWDTRDDAEQFHDSYLELLDSHGATPATGTPYTIPDSNPFGGAYRVTREGSTVRIVHGPTPESLSAIHSR